MYTSIINFLIDEYMLDKSVKCSQHGWATSLLSMLSEMYDARILCDMAIKTRDIRGNSMYIPCHSSVLAGSSPVLLSKLSGQQLTGKGRIVIECKAMSAAEWELVMQFVYKSNVDIVLRDIHKLWSVSRFLGILGLTMLLEDLMKEHGIMVPTKWKNRNEFGHWKLQVHFSEQNTNSNAVAQPITFPEIVDSYTTAKRQPIVQGSNLRFDDYISETIDSFINDTHHGSPVPTTDENDTCREDSEPKLKKRKMYKPRRVEQSCDTTIAPNVIGEICSQVIKQSPGNGGIMPGGSDALNSPQNTCDNGRVIATTTVSTGGASSAPRSTSTDQNSYSFPPLVIAPIDDNEMMELESAIRQKSKASYDDKSRA